METRWILKGGQQIVENLGLSGIYPPNFRSTSGFKKPKFFRMSTG